MSRCENSRCVQARSCVKISNRADLRGKTGALASTLLPSHDGKTATQFAVEFRQLCAQLQSFEGSGKRPKSGQSPCKPLEFENDVGLA